MSLINSIHYTIFDQTIPENRLPVVEIASSDMAYGSVEMELPLTTSAITCTVEIYRVLSPTSSENRYSKLLPNLYSSDILFYETSQLSSGYWKIDWQFLSSVVPGIGTDQEFVIEFSINEAVTATVTQASPKVIVKIKDIVGS